MMGIDVGPSIPITATLFYVNLATSNPNADSFPSDPIGIGGYLQAGVAVGLGVSLSSFVFDRGGWFGSELDTVPSGPFPNGYLGGEFGLDDSLGAAAFIAMPLWLNYGD